MIDFKTKTDAYDKTLFCEHATVSNGSLNRGNPIKNLKVICETCCYCCWVLDGSVLFLQTVVGSRSIYVYENHVLLPDGNLVPTHSFIRTPIDVKTFADTIKKRLLLL
jgi:hypothetical protein